MRLRHSKKLIDQQLFLNVNDYKSFSDKSQSSFKCHWRSHICYLCKCSLLECIIIFVLLFIIFSTICVTFVFYGHFLTCYLNVGMCTSFPEIYRLSKFNLNHPTKNGKSIQNSTSLDFDDICYLHRNRIEDKKCNECQFVWILVQTETQMDMKDNEEYASVIGEAFQQLFIGSFVNFNGGHPISIHVHIRNDIQWKDIHSIHDFEDKDGNQMYISIISIESLMTYATENESPLDFIQNIVYFLFCNHITIVSVIDFHVSLENKANSIEKVVDFINLLSINRWITDGYIKVCEFALHQLLPMNNKRILESEYKQMLFDCLQVKLNNSSK